MAPKTPKPPETAETFLEPASFIRAARAAHPAFAYALVAAGILAIVVVFTNFGVSYLTLVFGAIALIGLMVLFVVFAQVARLARATLDLPARVFVWAILLLTLALVGMLTSSVFFNVPLPIRDWVVRQLIERDPPGPVEISQVSEPTSQPISEPEPSPVDVNVALMAADVLESHKAVGYQVAFLQSWNHPPTRELLKVVGKDLVATTVSGDRTVTMTIDPDQLPEPQYYSSETVSGLPADPATAVTSFFAGVQQYRAAMTSLVSGPSDLLGALTVFQLAGETAFHRGILALCALGQQPPTLFDGRAFRDPEPAVCPGDEPISKELPSGAVLFSQEDAE